MGDAFSFSIVIWICTLNRTKNIPNSFEKYTLVFVLAVFYSKEKPYNYK